MCGVSGIQIFSSLHIKLVPLANSVIAFCIMTQLWHGHKGKRLPTFSLHPPLSHGINTSEGRILKYAQYCRPWQGTALIYSALGFSWSPFHCFLTVPPEGGDKSREIKKSTLLKQYPGESGFPKSKGETVSKESRQSEPLAVFFEPPFHCCFLSLPCLLQTLPTLHLVLS